MRKSIFIFAISLLLPIFCCAQVNTSTVSKSDVENYKNYANKGNTEAQYLLGMCYYEGEGVDKDLKQAFYWFKKAAEQGNANAKAALKIHLQHL